MNPLHSDLVLNEVSICTSPDVDIPGVEFNSKLNSLEAVLPL